MSDKQEQENPNPESAAEETAAEEQVSVEESQAETDGASAAGESPEAAAEETKARTPPDEEEESFKLQYLRLRADFDNFRKRTRREKEEWTQRCLENLCEDLLTVLDHFDLGLENSREVDAETLKGFQMVRGQLGSVLGKYGLSPVVAEKGPFDPNLHEAITHIPSPEVPEGEVVAMTRKGYQLGARLLRPAQVVVSAGGGDESVTPEEAGGEEG
jgi:molecular chaperone GrpE